MEDSNNKMTKAIVGGTWILSSSVVSILTGLIFWFVLTRIVGVSSVGKASAIVSSAGIATTLLSAGLSLAIIRVVASRGRFGVLASVMVSLMLGIMASSLSFLLSRKLGFGFSYYAGIMAFLSVASLAITQSMIGLEMFKDYFKTVFVSNLAKIIIGFSLAVLGLGSLAVILGYLSFPFVALIIGLTILLVTSRNRKRIKMSVIDNVLSDVKEVLKLMIANYPQGLSSQLLTALGVYIFALITKRSVDTGILYVSLMAVLAMAAVPGSVLTALLPSGSRGEISDIFYEEGLRIGLGLVTPLVIILLMAPSQVLSIISPDMTKGGDVLFVLSLSVVPFAAVQAGIIVLNAKKDLKMISYVGTIRLLGLTLSLLALVPRYGSVGAALSFLIANLASLPLAIKPIFGTILTITKMWLIQTGLWSLGILLRPLLGLDLSLTLVVLLSVSVLHITNILKVNEIVNIIKTVFSLFNKGD